MYVDKEMAKKRERAGSFLKSVLEDTMTWDEAVAAAENLRRNQELIVAQERQLKNTSLPLSLPRRSEKF